MVHTVFMHNQKKAGNLYILQVVNYKSPTASFQLCTYTNSVNVQIVCMYSCSLPTNEESINVLSKIVVNISLCEVELSLKLHPFIILMGVLYSGCITSFHHPLDSPLGI